MKANKKFRLDESGTVDIGVAVMIVALLVTIVIGVMVYFEFTESVNQFDEVIERFTGYTQFTFGIAGSNTTGIIITLANSPDGTSNCNVSCWNESHSGLGGSSTTDATSYPTFGLNHNEVKIAGEATTNFTQVNVTYTGHTATAEASDITPMAQTIFSLLPVIALVVVAAIILGVVLGLGRKGGGL